MHASISARLNADLLDENYEKWKDDPRSVDETWSAFFEGYEIGSSQSKRQKKAEKIAVTDGEAADPVSDELDLGRRAQIVSMVYNYRILGHTQAWLDPLSAAAPRNDRLNMEQLGFREDDLDTMVRTNFFRGAEKMQLRELIQLLETIYCDKIGFEFMHIHNTEVRHWLRDRIEQRIELPAPSVEQKFRLLRWLEEAETFESFLHRKYVGQKRFGLDGGESLMVSLGTILEGSQEAGVNHLVMGMAHRGRLNVLANLLRKPLKTVLYEFSENYVPNVAMGDGDVKYHLGFETVRTTESGHEVTISLAANPSHLEAVNGVVEGKARASQREGTKEDAVDRSAVLPVLIHGDAAFAGQGSVAEVLNLSQLPGYRTGGTIHLIINNQIGFTTTPEDARSSSYCTDVAKMIEAPIFHVNGDYPEEVAFVTQLALEFRQRYRRDVVIDIVCYRRHGHNEGDEPSFTLPTMYRDIRKHPSVSSHYSQKLIDEGNLTSDEADELRERFEARMNDEYEQLKQYEAIGNSHVFAGSSAVFQGSYTHKIFKSGISAELLRRIGMRLTELPEGFDANDKLDKRFIEPRRKAIENGGPINWAFAESLAFGSLLLEGRSIRLSGQDSRRGTFNQRHAVLYDSSTDQRKRHFPLRHLIEKEGGAGNFYVYNSLLSEYAVLGFEYGYSLVAKDCLVLWEAQFGDFSNGAQVIIDQFISSAESKWAQPSSIMMLLPHGYEGMGPEHSSARIERFLQLCAEANMEVCNLTTPAQYFHLLRRQALRKMRKPLILATPKSLLGNPVCVSHEADFTENSHFQEIMDDDQLVAEPDRVTRLIFCSGKVYYDLLKYRNENQLKNSAIIRVEQLYPFNEDLVMKIASRYHRAHKKWVWCQEEPLNMGGWTFIGPRLQTMADRVAGGSHTNVRYAGRSRASSPAAGAKAIHIREQARLVEQAFSV